MRPQPSGSPAVPAARTTAAICPAICSPTAATSCAGCRALAGLPKSVSVGQKIGHLIGCPARLICRQPPASVAAFVAAHSPIRRSSM
jgi:hypothetical protein